MLELHCVLSNRIAIKQLGLELPPLPPLSAADAHSAINSNVAAQIEALKGVTSSEFLHFAPPSLPALDVAPLHSFYEPMELPSSKRFAVPDCCA